MSGGSTHLLNQPSDSDRTVRDPSARWILNSGLDLLLFVLTPILILPLALLVKSPWVGLEVETISLIVMTFGALGHHFPGMIRTYCDRDLFQRFRMRFLLVPPLLFALYFPLNYYHRSYMMLIFSTWGCWHGLMQVYGFVRIYDVKVGSVSRVTADWDWLMCLCWFVTAEFFSSNKTSASGQLELWYHLHGVTPPIFVQMFRWICLAVSVAVLIAFLTNHVVQTYRGPKPNSAKLLMLSSGIGFWWFAMVFIENPILGVALFEVFHDVQYLAIVWIYNCRRVKSNSEIGAFMKFIFRRGMLILYVGLVFVYGLIGLVPRFAQNDALKTIFTGLIQTSTIMHFYFDGFIWKVRETSTQAGLGLVNQAADVRSPIFAWGKFNHLLKWSPLIMLFSWLLIGDLMNSSTSVSKRQQDDEAIEFLETLLQQSPANASGHQRLGEIYRSREELDKAVRCFQTAIEFARNKDERAVANHRLGEVYLQQQHPALAVASFREALQHDPQLEAAKEALSSIAPDPVRSF